MLIDLFCIGSFSLYRPLFLLTNSPPGRNIEGRKDFVDIRPERATAGQLDSWGRNHTRNGTYIPPGRLVLGTTAEDRKRVPDRPMALGMWACLTLLLVCRARLPLPTVGGTSTTFEGVGGNAADRGQEGLVRIRGVRGGHGNWGWRAIPDRRCHCLGGSLNTTCLARPREE